MVEREVGQPLASAGELEFVVEIGSARACMTARLHVLDPKRSGQPAERRLTQLDCERLFEAVAVVIALTIDVRDDPDATAPPATLHSLEPPHREELPAGAALSSSV